MDRLRAGDIAPGLTVGLWTVLKKLGGKTLCRCRCGKEKLLHNRNLLQAVSGCKPCSLLGNEFRKFLKGTDLTRAAYRKLAQCVHHRLSPLGPMNNPNHKQWKDYGGRGITVCDAWKTDPAEFIEYLATLPGHDNPDLVLDRIDNDGNYEPGNLRFATSSVSNFNRRRFSPRRRKAGVGSPPSRGI